MFLPNHPVLLTILYEYDIIHPGDTVYAYNGLTGKIPPAKGRLTCSMFSDTPCEQTHPFQKDKRYPAWYFKPDIIPKNDSKRPYDISNRKLATTEEEAWWIFEQDLQTQMTNMEHRLETLKNLHQQASINRQQFEPSFQTTQMLQTATMISSYHSKKTEQFEQCVENLSAETHIPKKTYETICKNYLRMHPSLKQWFK